MPKLIDHEAREVAVAEAAWRVLLRDGITKISVRNVSAEAGLATGSLRRSFPTQESLLVFSVELVRRRAKARISQLPPSRSVREGVEVRLAHLLPLDDDRRVEMEVYHAIGALATTSPALTTAYDSVLSDVRAACRAALERLDASGDLDASGLDLDHEAAALHATLDGLALHLLAGDGFASGASARRILSDHLDRLGHAPRRRGEG